MMNLDKAVPGTELCSDDQKHVLAAYCHRFTKDHKPRWADEPRPNGKPYPVHHESDAHWLAATLFQVRNDGRLDNRVRYCHSTPAWPDNPELRR